MNLKYSHTLLLVDDELSILKSLKRLLRKEKYQVLTATNGREALDVLTNADKEVSLIISDQRMPEMTGAQFLAEAVNIAPDSVRFLLTGYADLNAVAEAVNKGRIHRYITKPWDDDEINELIRMALSQVELRIENKRLTELTERQNAELAKLNKDLEKKVQERTWALQVQNKMLKGANTTLEKSVMNVIRLLSSLVEYSNADLSHYLKKTAEFAKELACEANLDEQKQNQIEMAGLVHDIGLLGMPDHMVAKDFKAMDRKEFKAYSQHPMVASLCMSSIEGFNEISEIVSCHHEHLDGSGFPRKLTARQIPLEAKILSVAADYCRMLHLWPDDVRELMNHARRYLSRDALSDMDITDASMKNEITEKVIREGAGTCYDPDIVTFFLQILDRKYPKPEIFLVRPEALKEGMTVMQELRLKDGRLLLNKGTILNERCIQSIHNVGLSNLTDQHIQAAWPIQANQPEANHETQPDRCKDRKSQ
jgi:response regulator RpfG family c-di-GMP phosphodiesterase